MVGVMAHVAHMEAKTVKQLENVCSPKKTVKLPEPVSAVTSGLEAIT